MSSSEYIFSTISSKICLLSSQISMSWEIDMGFSGEEGDDIQHILNMSILLLNWIKISCLSELIYI